MRALSLIWQLVLTCLQFEYRSGWCEAFYVPSANPIPWTACSIKRITHDPSRHIDLGIVHDSKGEVHLMLPFVSLWAYLCAEVMASRIDCEFLSLVRNVVPFFGGSTSANVSCRSQAIPRVVSVHLTSPRAMYGIFLPSSVVPIHVILTYFWRTSTLSSG